MTTHTITSSLHPQTPVGTVMTYAGSTLDQDGLKKMGWLLCDGSLIDATQYTDLVDALETTWGGEASGKVYLPDLRGVFLRGVDNGKGIDPDSQSRTDPQPKATVGGNSGDNVGSFQADALAKHTHDYKLPGGKQGALVAVGGHELVEIDSTTTSDSNPQAGSGDETRPINIYVNFIICYDNTVPDFQLPPGSVVPFSALIIGNEFEAQGWLPCDGRLLSNSQEKYAALSKAIGQAYGGTFDNGFALPDYRGRFLRGVDDGRGLDPDAKNRQAPSSHPVKGNTGDAVGSIQEDAMRPHIHSYTTFNNYHQVDPGAADSAPSYDTTSTGSFKDSGGAEARPVNQYVNYLIKF